MKTFRLIIILLFFSSQNYSQTTISNNSGIEFINNLGQWNENVLYKADIPGGAFFLEKNCFTFSFKDMKAINNLIESKHVPKDKRREISPEDNIINCHAYKVIFLNANNDVSISGDKKIDGFYNFFMGSDTLKWASGVKSFSNVNYSNLYEKTDLKIYKNNSRLKYDIILHPGADAARIKFLYEGADSVYINNSNLIVKTSVNEITEMSPEAYQIINGIRVTVPCTYDLKDNVVSFVFQKGYDKSEELIIDPTLVFSTYSGSTADNWGFTATYDTSGCVYSGGIAFGTGYPVSTGAFQMNFAGGDPGSYIGGCDIAIIKYNATGTQRLWASYLGGNSEDLPHSMIVNNNNELVVYGTTGSSNFPVTSGSYDQTFNGGAYVYYDNSLQFSQGTDIFVSKISNDGLQLLASTFVGGTENDGLNYPSALSYNYGDGARGEIMTDNNNNVFVVSTTNSTDFPVTAGAFQTSPGGGGQDGIVFKMTPSLSGMLWSSYLGGNSSDAVYGIVLDDNDNVYVTGGTASINFPTTSGTLHTSFLGGLCDGFITEISQDGSNIIKSTYYGSNAYDQSYLIGRGNGGKIYVFGQTAKTGNTFIYNATWATPSGGQFISKIEPDLSTLIWSTAFGTGLGGPDISPNAFCIDNCRNIYISGWGGSSLNGFGGTSGLPVTSNAFQSTTDDNDFYFLVIDDNASYMVYGSFFGGIYSYDHVDGGTSRFDSKGIIYNAVCAGCYGYDDFPTTPGVWSTTNNSSNCNNAVIKFDFQLTGVNAIANGLPNDTGCAPFPVNFINTSNGASYVWDFDDGTTSTLTTPSHTFAAAGTYNVMLVAIDSAKCNISDTIYLTIEVVQGTTVDLGNDLLICTGDSVILGAGNPGMDYLWSTGDTSQTIVVTGYGTFWVEVNNGFCPSYDTIDIFIAQVDTLVIDTNACEGSGITLDAGNAGGDFLWSTGDTSQTIHTDSSGTFWVNILVGNCIATDTFHVVIEPNPVVDIGNDTVFCGSFSMLLDAGNPGSQYLWSTGENSQTINVDTTGEYWVLVSAMDCSSSDTMNISTIYPPELGPDLILCELDRHTLDAGPSHGDFLWSTGETTQTIHVNEPGLYWVQVVTPNCLVTDSIKVDYGGSLSVFFPNTFTPDADELNDVFKGVGVEITYYDLKIFTRWGQQIFQTSDPETGWDGTFEGKKVQQDIYVWTADFKTTCTGWNVQHKIGHIFLLR
jgi:gliding motility-associated-like protein